MLYDNFYVGFSISLSWGGAEIWKYVYVTPFLNPFPRGKDLPSLRSKFFLCQMFWFMVPSLSLWAVLTAHYASCTINHAKIKIFGDYYIVILICINYFKNRTKTWCFVHSEPPSCPTPSTLCPLFVDGTALQTPPVHILGCFCDRDTTGCYY